MAFLAVSREPCTNQLGKKFSGRGVGTGREGVSGQRSVEMEAADFYPVPQLKQTEGPVRVTVTEKLFLTRRLAAAPFVGNF